MAEITSLDIYHRENQVTTLDLFPHNSYSYSIDDPTLNRELELGLGFSIESTHLFYFDDDVADYPSGFLPSDRADRFFSHPIESSTIPFVKLDTCFDEEIESSMGIDFGFCFEDGISGDERERADGMVDEREDMTMFFPSDPVELSTTIPFFDEEIDDVIGIDFIRVLEGEFRGDERERANGTVYEREGMNMNDDDDDDVAMEEMGIDDWENAMNFRHLDGLSYDEFHTLTRHLESDDGGGVRNPPAASRNAVENLSAVVVTDADVERGDATCVICRDEMVVGEKAKSLPCLHRYHWCCIDPWLRMRNTCPVCRYELPTDDS